MIQWVRPGLEESGSLEGRSWRGDRVDPDAHTR